ncbi:hypothetical protein CDES_12860 [Corynebacterium deserti GIMN1.010]|uniref:Uncharacterized protein n=1 Tax=Corynebacterium deserti GIMN1.010 TaxID=931089 RepID=A0A0M4CFJ4_9CORY|nr:hypothetical protein [Corynebacterium deserti]ALC06916.1 hypothetical protein CDES_12860 [Corynebacterium deserti GIMN1.010]
MKVSPGIELIEDKTVHFTDGSSQEYDSIIWATGFHTSLPFIGKDLLRWEDGVPVRYAGGILPEGVEKLFFVGQSHRRVPWNPIDDSPAAKV